MKEQYRLAEMIRYHLDQPVDPQSFANRVRRAELEDRLRHER